MNKTESDQLSKRKRTAIQIDEFRNKEQPEQVISEEKERILAEQNEKIQKLE